MTAGVHHVARHYTDEQFQRIANVSGVTDVRARETLGLGIEHAATWFLSDLRSRGHPTPSEIERGLDKMRNSASRLLRALGLTEADNPQDGMLPGPLRDRLEWALCPNPEDHTDIDVEAGLRKLIAAVGELEALAKMARADAAKDKGERKYESNKALNEFITNLMLVYRQAGAEPGVSRNPKTGVPSGPTLRLVRACLKHLIENFSCAEPALVRYIPTQSDEALAKRIQRAKSQHDKSMSK